MSSELPTPSRGRGDRRHRRRQVLPHLRATPGPPAAGRCCRACAGSRPGTCALFQEFWALRDISFSIGRGRDASASSGATAPASRTLLQIICGTLTPTRGEVAVQGRVAALLELGSGFNPEFTGRENVYLNGVDPRPDAAPRWTSASTTSSRFADIGEFIDQPVKTYSSGMFVRLAFAVIANVDADILVVDEALAVGDVFFAPEVHALPARLPGRRGTLVFVSHELGRGGEPVPARHLARQRHAWSWTARPRKCPRPTMPSSYGMDVHRHRQRRRRPGTRPRTPVTNSPTRASCACSASCARPRPSATGARGSRRSPCWVRTGNGCRG